jgi:hypothetical protein
MNIRFKHTNLVAADWRKLAGFNREIFGCVPVPPERSLSGTWLEKGTGVKGAEFSGIHLLLPGAGENGPTLEIYEYRNNKKKTGFCRQPGRFFPYRFRSGKCFRNVGTHP